MLKENDFATKYAVRVSGQVKFTGTKQQVEIFQMTMLTEAERAVSNIVPVDEFGREILFG